MDFVTGALPNVMFIVGIIAIGVALGIEFKIVEVKGQLSKTGRISTFVVGSVLILTSIYLYTRPAQQTATALAGTPGIPATVIPARGNEVLAAAPVAAAAQPVQPTLVVQPVSRSDDVVATGGIIGQVSVRNNQTIVVIDQVIYVLPTEIVASLGSSLRVGTTLSVVGTRMGDGTVVVSSAMASASPEAGHGKKDKGKDKEDED